MRCRQRTLAGGNGYGGSDRHGKEKESFCGESRGKDDRRRLRAYYKRRIWTHAGEKDGINAVIVGSSFTAQRIAALLGGLNVVMPPI